VWGRKRAGDRIAKAVADLEESVRALSDAELGRMTGKLRGRLADEPLDALLPDALAAAREAGRRAIGQRAEDEQIAGAAALCRGRLVEMKTGEGKTLAIALAAYVWSLPDSGVHVITANDYLAERDCTWMRPLYEALGATCAIVSREDGRAWAMAYRADVTYLTTSAAANDYLIGNTFTRPGVRPQRPLRRAIVDEADLLLIDDADYRANFTKKIDADELFVLYRNMARMVARLDRERHCVVDGRRRLVTLTDEGVALMEDLLGVQDLNQATGPELQRALDDCLCARFGYEKDRDYVVLDGSLSALNRATGRIDGVIGFPDGLGHALELKEGLEPSPWRRLRATISHGGLLRLYPHLAAATGTAVEERLYREAYGLEIERIPTHRPVIRIDHAPLYYLDEERRTPAALDRIAGCRAAGQPVLVVTASIPQCTRLSAALRDRGIPHETLTANNHRHEAEIVSRAGRIGAVTLVTRMAGRGVDIRLGGDDAAEHETVVAAGGLCVLGFDLFENRRLELHMRGRAGRRGDPGESAILLSLEDESTAAWFTARALRQLSSLVKNGPLDTKFVISRALLGSLDKATQRQEARALEKFRGYEVGDRQTVEIYRLRDEIIDDEGRSQDDIDGALSVIDELWCEHLVALDDIAAETILHGLSGSAWEARYRQQADRLFLALRARIDSRLAEDGAS